ncbi:hypothetical protein A9199_12125 [Donghicola sp. JL3646]|nr:hypothetical protein A9199_12125 [Donghicola sp. JL3646]
MSLSSTSRRLEGVQSALEVTVCEALGDPKTHDAQKLHRAYGDLIGNPTLVRQPNVDFRVIADILKSKFPWATDAVELVLGEIALKQVYGDPRLSSVLKPFLLVGQPGSGKTKFATELSQILGLPMDILSGGVADSGGLQAVSRGWSSTLPCGPFLAMHRHKCANPVILIDEIDKAKDGASNGHIWTTLLSMLNADGQFYDGCLMANVDLRFVNFWATANTISEMPRPLIDRFIVVQMPSPGAEFSDRILDSIVADHLSSIGAQGCPAITQLERHKIKQVLKSKDGSIRKMQQTFAALLRKKALQEVLPVMHHDEAKENTLIHWPSPSEALH